VPELAVPLVSKRLELVLALQKVQHVVPALALLVQGVGRLAHEGHGWSLLLGAAELVTSALVIGAFVYQIRAVRVGAQPSHADAPAAPHHGVDWLDLFLGAMLGVEVWAHWHETGHIKRPTVLLAAAMIVLGFLHGKIAGGAARRRGLWVSDTGLRVSRRPFSRFTAAWEELAAIDITPREVRIVRRDGKSCVLDLNDLRNAADVRAALEGARLRLPTPAPAPDARLEEPQPHDAAQLADGHAVADGIPPAR
jgi:hypothetical protein